MENKETNTEEALIDESYYVPERDDKFPTSIIVVTLLLLAALIALIVNTKG